MEGFASSAGRPSSQVAILKGEPTLSANNATQTRPQSLRSVDRHEALQVSQQLAAASLRRQPSGRQHLLHVSPEQIHAAVKPLLLHPSPEQRVGDAHPGDVVSDGRPAGASSTTTARGSSVVAFALNLTPPRSYFCPAPTVGCGLPQSQAPRVRLMLCFYLVHGHYEGGYILQTSHAIYSHEVIPYSVLRRRLAAGRLNHTPSPTYLEAL